MTNLIEFPTEVLEIIFEELPPKFLCQNVKLVCKKFNNIISNEQWWRVQINRKKYYLTHTEANDPKFLAVRTFENIRKEERRWLHDNENVVQQFTEPCASTIDGVRLFRTKDPDLRRFCLAGCRDRSLTLWHLQDIGNPNDTLPICLQRIDGAHDGWIWRIDKVTEEGKFMTCGWDQMCKEWQIGENGMITELAKYELPSAATCSARITPHQFIVGTFNHTIHLFDTREPPKKYGNQFDLHKRAIIGLENKDHYIYTTSEDRHITMSDIRMTSPKAINDKILRVYAPSLSLNANQLTCGYGNRIRIMDPLTLNTVHEFVAFNSGSVRQVIHNSGIILAMTTTRQLAAFSPGLRNERWAELTTPSEPSRFDYLDGDLCVGLGDGSLLMSASKLAADHADF